NAIDGLMYYNNNIILNEVYNKRNGNQKLITVLKIKQGAKEEEEGGKDNGRLAYCHFILVLGGLMLRTFDEHSFAAIARQQANPRSVVLYLRTICHTILNFLRTGRRDRAPETEAICALHFVLVLLSFRVRS
ncbi:hypothetical protein ACJX0J_021523, partial [Zea mays]